MANLEEIFFIKLAGNNAQIIDGNIDLDKFGEIHSFDSFREIEEGTKFSCMVKVGYTGFTPVFSSIKPLLEDDTQNLEWYDFGGVWISPEEKEIFDVVASIVDDGGYANITCVGQSGLGKTSRAIALAKALDYDLVVVDVGSIQTMRDWWYTKEVKDMETTVALTELAEKLPGGRLVVLFDDNNRANPALHNSLMPILDFRRAVRVVHEHIQVGPSVVFMQTLNEGYGFVGTQNLDLAFINRFDIVLEVTAPPKEVEEQIILDRYPLNGETKEIVRLLREMREDKIVKEATDVSTRTALKIAKLVYHGMSISAAFKVCLANGKAGEVQKAIFDVLKGV